MTSVYFLGTNGWFSTETGDTPCLAIETQSYNIICDAGNGIRRIDELLDLKKPTYLFLSHFHIDHISGLHMLEKFQFQKPLMIVCFKGSKKILNVFMNQPFTISLPKLSFKTNVIELGEGVYKKFPFGLKCRELLHSSKTYGYRFEIDGKSIAYCTDTGRCEGLLDLAHGADLLVTECAFKSGQVNAKWPHLNPEEAASLARESEAKRLALMHFDAHLYRTPEERKEAEQIAQRIFPRSYATHDRLRIEI